MSGMYVTAEIRRGRIAAIHLCHEPPSQSFCFCAPIDTSITTTSSFACGQKSVITQSNDTTASNLVHRRKYDIVHNTHHMCWAECYCVRVSVARQVCVFLFLVAPALPPIIA
jgi:hypothetical protein